MHYSISPITKNELEIALLEWASKEGWHYSREDVDTYYALESSKIFALKLESEFIGCVIATFYNNADNTNTIGSIGLYLVKQEFRGKILAGLNQTPGLLLWRQALEALNNCTISCLNSVSTSRLLNYYTKKGFKQTGTANVHLSSSTFFHHSKCHSPEFEQLDSITANQTKIIEYDSKLFTNYSPERQKFITNWLSRPDAIIAAYESDNKVEGYGIMTLCYKKEERKIGRLSPAYANSIDVAAKLIQFLLANSLIHNIKEIELYCPNINEPITTVLKEYGFNSDPEGNTYLMTNKNCEENQDVLLKTIALAPLEFPHESILATL